MSDAPSNPTPTGSSEERTWAMIAHLTGLIGFVGPLIVWLVQKDKMPFVDDQGKEALNFQLTVLIAYAVAGATSCFGVGLVVFPVVFVANVVLCIMGGLKANQGESYRYPLTLRLIK